MKIDPASGRPILAEPAVALVALHWGDLSSFGRQPPSLLPPARGELLASDRLARELELTAGDTVQLLVANSPYTFTVSSIVQEQGVAGYGTPFLNRGTVLLNLEEGQELFVDGQDQVNTVFISNAGGVEEGARNTQTVQQALSSLARGAQPLAELQVTGAKAELMDETEWIGQVFLGVSSFGIVAGIMLVMNLYAMLAEERRTEMGVIRALGARSGHLTRIYIFEGFSYSLGAAVVGVLVGLGLAWLVVLGMNRFVFVPTSDLSVHMEFIVKPSTLVVGGAIGFLVAIGTVLFTSLRISSINIVAAMRDLPEPLAARRRRWAVLWPFLLAVVGVLMTYQAVVGDNGALYVLGPMLAAVGLGLLLRRYLPSRALLSLVFLGLMAFSQLAFQIPAVEAADDEDTTVFFLTSMILVLAFIAVVVLNFSIVVWLMRQTIGRMRRILPVVRLAIAYPAERPVRTGFILAMFALVIFGTTVVSIFIASSSGQSEQIRRGAAGGFDAIVAVNPLNPISDLDARLSSSAVVESNSIHDISALWTAGVELPQYRQSDYMSSKESTAVDSEAPLFEQVTGLDEVFLSTTKSALDVRAPEYASDRDVWEALARDSSVVVVDDTYTGNTFGVWRPVVVPGDVLQLRDPQSGTVYEKRVIGRMASDPGWLEPPGILMSQWTLELEFASVRDANPNFYLLRLREGVELKAVANSIEKELIAHGAQVYLVSEVLGIL